MINDLMLLAGSDIPFPQARITIHVPTIKEIGYIGEEKFFTGCELLNFSKDILSSEDKSRLVNKSNFEVFMSIMRDRSTAAIQNNRISALMVLSLIFPNYQIDFKDKIILTDEKEESFFIDNNNFEHFKGILAEMFCLKRNRNDPNSYNPANETARKIAEKLAKGRQKAAAAKGEDNKKLSVLNRYVSILAVGEKKNINDLMQLTVYQLFDEFERFELKQSYDIYFEAKLAGAKDIKEVENWMKDLHP